MSEPTKPIETKAEAKKPEEKPVVSATPPVAPAPAAPVEKDPVPVKPYDFDAKAFTDKAVRLEGLVQTKAGVRNYNPYVWFTKRVAPLIKRFKQSERSEALFREMMSIEETIPPINPEDGTAENKPAIPVQGGIKS